MAAPIDRYGVLWPGEATDLQIEIACIQNGGSWMIGKVPAGAGLFHHYRAMQSLLWPEDDHHRWSDLILSEILKNTITAILGPKDSSKTHTASKFALCDYYCFSEETLILISSTDLRGLEMRVWGDIKSLHERALNRHDGIPGHILESKHAICTDDLSDEAVVSRDMRKGILCIPCLSSSGQFTGISKYVGMKQKRRRLIADESQFMHASFLESLANLNAGDFKGVFMGNPLGQDDPLDKISEPKSGWTALPEPEKTATWDNRFLGGRTINLVGTDSPNFDEATKGRYHYLINQKSIDNVTAFYGLESSQYYSQCKGVRRSGLNARRVITRELCEQFHAFDDIEWKGDTLTKIAAMDAAYGGVGGDRCVIGHVSFGLCVDDKIRVFVSPPVLVPVSAKLTKRPEDQIAEFTKAYCESNGITPDNFFYDSTGRGSLGPAFARIWSPNIQPVEFGGPPTTRPVSTDLLMYDPKTRERRAKLCNEHYRKFVTELWFSVRYIIESDQMRGLPQEVAAEGYQREWKLVQGDRIEIESKEDMKKRTNRSPDLFDWLVTACEGARRRGFAISKLGNTEVSQKNMEWLRDMRDNWRQIQKRHELMEV